MNKKLFLSVIFALAIFGLIGAKSVSAQSLIDSILKLMRIRPEANKPLVLPSIAIPSGPKTKISMKKFSSLEEFREFLRKNDSSARNYSSGLRGEIMLTDAVMAPVATNMMAKASSPEVAPQDSVERVSGTNVQVLGIDEPDIIKTNGAAIFFSPNWTWRSRPTPLLKEETTKSNSATSKVSSLIAPMPPLYNNEPKINVVSAWPLDKLAYLGEIDKRGEMLLENNTLVVFATDGVFAYDVKDLKSPQRKWNIKYKGNTGLQTARLHNGKIYLVTRTGINRYSPCPIIPLEVNAKKMSVACNDIWYPDRAMQADTTFSVWTINMQSGEVSNKVSFVASARESVVYMSEENLYIGYSFNGDGAKIFTDFFKTKASDLIPGEIISKIEKVGNLDISKRAKDTEIQYIWENYFESFEDYDQRLKLANDLNNRFADYYKSNFRNFESTGIVKISLGDLAIRAQGEVAGRPLNQFCMDEYKGNLRIATTAGNRGLSLWLSGINFSNSQSANDVYVLDAALKNIGSVKDLGLGERIYSARFIAERGYIVTFKQTDPFYVLDLSNPASPKLKGELKIPGYSGYLHPLANNIILGVGQEDWKLKLSLFDVSNPANPQELDKYLMQESYSEAINNHKAFLQDAKHKVFFLPGGSGGYVFGYEGNKLKLVKAVSEINARRAVFINDYMYIIHDNGLVVLDETKWEKATELDFNK